MNKGWRWHLKKNLMDGRMYQAVRSINVEC